MCKVHAQLSWFLQDSKIVNWWAFEADGLEKPITKGPVKPKRSNHCYQMSQRPETAFVYGACPAAHVSTSSLDHRFQRIPLTLQGTNISPKNGILKMIFLFPRWDMLIPWRVSLWFFPGFFNSGDAASSAGGGVAAGAGAAWQNWQHHQVTRRSQENTWLGGGFKYLSDGLKPSTSWEYIENNMELHRGQPSSNSNAIVTRFCRKWWTSSDSHWPADSLLTKQRQASRCQAYRTTRDCLWKSAFEPTCRHFC